MVSGFCGGIPFGLCVSDGGVFSAENALVFNGKTYRPEGLSIQREEGVWYVSTPDGHIQLYVPVIASRTDRIKLMSLNAERNREYGQCLGELTMLGQRYMVDNATGCGEHVASKC